MRCECITTKKKQCTREAVRGSKYCKQHANCKSPKREKKAKSPIRSKIDPRKEERENENALSDVFMAEPVQHTGSPKEPAAPANAAKQRAQRKARVYKKHLASRRGLVASELVYGVDKTHVLPKRIIGQGTYGCVTLPAIPCEGSREMDYEGLVSKVLNEAESLKELEEGKNLSSADVLISGEPHTLSARYRYGVYALDRCAFPLLDENEIDSFDSAANGPCRAGQARALGYVLHMERADADFSRGRSLVTASNYKPWLLALKNALDGLANMHAHFTYHFDVKPQNMLYFLNEDKSPRTIKLNDFGLTCTLDNPKFRESIAFYVPWFNFPPAATLIASRIMYNNVNLQSAVEKAVEYFPASDFKIECVDEELYSKGGILRTAELWSGGLSKHELASRIDLYGFALSLDKCYDKVPSDMQTVLANFCTCLTEMKWGTERAVREFDLLLS
jgi:hypothetical protein